METEIKHGGWVEVAHPNGWVGCCECGWVGGFSPDRSVARAAMVAHVQIVEADARHAAELGMAHPDTEPQRPTPGAASFCPDEGWVSDPGHAWLKLHAETMTRLAPRFEPSRFSYAGRGFVYLEEDCDAPAFLVAAGLWTLGEAVPYFPTVELHERSDAPCRRFRQPWDGDTMAILRGQAAR